MPVSHVRICLIHCTFFLSIILHRAPLAVVNRLPLSLLASCQVVGYICHELRNPLHIVRTSFKSLAVFALQRLYPVPSTAGGPASSLARMASQRSMMQKQQTGAAVVTDGAPPNQGCSNGSGTSFTIVSSPTNMLASCDGFEGLVDEEDEDLSPTELKSVVSDALAALAQMQSTVNEVLDFRAIESGVNSLKLNKEPLTLHQVRCICLRRCK